MAVTLRNVGVSMRTGAYRHVQARVDFVSNDPAERAVTLQTMRVLLG